MRAGSSVNILEVIMNTCPGDLRGLKKYTRQLELGGVGRHFVSGETRTPQNGEGTRPRVWAQKVLST